MKKSVTISLPSLDSLPHDTQQFLAQLPALNIYRTIATIPSSLEPFIALAHSLYKDGGVPPRLLEISILRVAYVNKCDYQWHEHEQIALSVGITEAELAILKTAETVDSLSPEENLICKVADELTLHAKLDDALSEKFFAHYSALQAIAIILCISFYNMVSRLVNATRIPIEANDLLKGKSSPFN